jgi:hypothetical protein
MVTMAPGRATDDAMQFEQMNPGAALTTSQMVDHITVLTGAATLAPRADDGNGKFVHGVHRYPHPGRG